MKKRSSSLSLGDFLNAAHRSLEPLGPAEEVEVRRLGAAYLRQLRKLSQAAKAKDFGQLRSRLHRMFRSPGAKVGAALLGYPKCENRRNPKGPRRRPKVSLPKLKALARDVSMYHPTGEPIRVMQIKKAGGGTRTVASFGRRARAAQQLALDAARAIHGESEFEFARKGLGREAAVEQVLNGINKRGVCYVAQTDVEDFFPSVDPQAVWQSGILPKSVLRHHVIMDRQKTLTTNPPISKISDRARLWQGAIGSSYFASKMIEPALMPLRRRLGLIYVDNIFSGANMLEEAEVRLDTLAQSLAEHPAGPFQLKFRDISRVGGDHNILGYRVVRDATDYGGEARAKPSRTSICKHQRQLLLRLMYAASVTYESETKRWARSWPKHYPLWSTRRTAHHLAEIVAMQEVWPVARRVRKHVKDARIVFKSFAELQALGAMFTLFLKPEPDWAAIEGDIAQKGSTARIKMNFRTARDFPAGSYTNVIGRFLENRNRISKNMRGAVE